MGLLWEINEMILNFCVMGKNKQVRTIFLKNEGKPALQD